MGNLDAGFHSHPNQQSYWLNGDHGGSRRQQQRWHQQRTWAQDYPSWREEQRIRDEQRFWHGGQEQFGRPCNHGQGGERWQREQWARQEWQREQWLRQQRFGDQQFGPWNGGNRRWGYDQYGQTGGHLSFDLGGIRLGVSLGGQNGPRFFIGGQNFHRPRNAYWPGEDSGRWSYDPMTGERCFSGMSPRQMRIMQRASGGDPRFFQRFCPQNDDFRVRIPGGPQPDYDPGYYPEGDFPGPPRSNVPYQYRDNYGLSGSPEDVQGPHGPGNNQWEYDRRREEMVRRRTNKEPRPSDRTARGPRRGEDSPTSPEAFQRLQQVTQQLEGRVITEFDHTVPSDLGCARAISLALSNTYGIRTVDQSTAALEQHLPQWGFVEVPWEERRAGDVMVAHRDQGRKSHAAIYMGDGQIFNNSSPKGYMTTESEAKLYNPEYRYIKVYRKVR